jgi:hypothetical protein
VGSEESENIDMETAVPLVTGRHRNRALAAHRRRVAVELALTGRTYQQIADEMGYANRGTVYRIVQRTLQDRVYESVDDLRRLEVARLDALQSRYWSRAMSGDLGAAGVVLRVIDRRARLLGLADSPAGARLGESGMSPCVPIDPSELVACGGLPAGA